MFKRGKSRVPLEKIPLLVKGTGGKSGAYVSTCSRTILAGIRATSSRNCSVNYASENEEEIFLKPWRTATRNADPETTVKIQVAVTQNDQVALGKAGLSHNPARDNELDDRCRRSTATVVGRPIADLPFGCAELTLLHQERRAIGAQDHRPHLLHRASRMRPQYGQRSAAGRCCRRRTIPRTCAAREPFATIDHSRQKGLAGRVRRLPSIPCWRGR